MSTPVKSVPSSINSWNAEYLDEAWRRYQSDPGSVPEDLQRFFQGFELALAQNGQAATAPAPAAEGRPREEMGDGAFEQAVAGLVWAYRSSGHLCAAIDPFGRARPRPKSLDPEWHGISTDDLERRVQPRDVPLDEPIPLKDVISILEQTYCGPIGVEYMHIQSEEERAWFTDRLERSRSRPNLERGDKLHVLLQLHRAEMFETFLHKRYLGQKRFSLEGGESLIPLLDRIIEHASDLDVEEIVLGMPHRGRLNVLNNIIGKSYEQIFTEFEANWDEDFVEGGGDVKYHLGFSGDRELRNGKKVRVVMSSNPSHLESVNGVVGGRCRAKQRLRGDTERRRVAPLLIHGDAAFTAQGIVMETLNMAGLEGYTVGGTVHVIVNNLIGFTTGPEDARSSTYCTDVVKMVDAPVFHVNAEEPEAVVLTAQLALEYRQTFGRDVVIDMLCYRKWGHNEGDDPSFTQPVMADLIKNKPSALETYRERLVEEGVIQRSDAEQMEEQLHQQMEKAQSSVSEKPHDPTIDPGSWRWEGFGKEYAHEPVGTGVPREDLQEVIDALGRWPDDFDLHRNLKKLLQRRVTAMNENEPLDWGAAEMLAYGSLLADGIAVRLSGQDSRRGTFSHRHAVIRDQRTGEPYTPLNHIRPERGAMSREDAEDGGKQATFCVYDSPLSEEGVLAFEYGYSLADPSMLIIWEAQFGDFCNGAQVIIDQYIASAEAKWRRWSGLTLLLPHAYEGQGPEHSSARLERFLQLCADDNIQVVYPTTPAQCFHMLRRQVTRKFRKPLIVMSPKSLLRLPAARSRIEELTSGCFQEIIDDPTFEKGGKQARGKVKRVGLCSGKFYYDLLERRDEIERNDVALVRVEQLYPLHHDLLAEIVDRYPSSAEIVWMQEEPKNMGAYQHMDRSVQDLLGWSPLAYIGREASATPATGSKKQHDAEQEQILADAVGSAGKKEKKEAVAS